MSKDKPIKPSAEKMKRLREANDIFDEAKKRFREWIMSNPTGKFSITIPVHQGGIRKHRFFVEEDG